jgi:multidrug resistance efflux pump
LIDLTDAPFDPGRSIPDPNRSSQPFRRHRTKTGRMRRWRARLLVLAMVAAAVFGGIRLAETRAYDARLVDIGTVTLTAQPVPIEAIRPSRVSTVSVRAQQHVAAGQELGRITSIVTTGSGESIQRGIVLRAPIDGIVSHEPAPVGATLQLGEAFVHLYDPNRLTLIANVPLDELPKLTPGMTATLHGADLPRAIHAVVNRVIPRLGVSEWHMQQDHLAVELIPVRRDYVAKFVPGLRFTGTVDPDTRPPGAEQSIFVQR